MTKPPDNLKNILIIHTYGGLGDLLLSTPVIHSFKKHFKNASIDVMVKESFQDILKDNKAADNVIPIPSSMLQSREGFFQQLKLIKKKPYQAGVVLWSTAREAYLLFLAGIPIRVGQAGRLLYSFLFTHPVTRRSDYGDTETHWVENQLDYVRSMGIEPEDKEVYLSIPPEAESFAQSFLKDAGIKEDRPIIGFHSTKGLPVDSSRWPLQKFASIASGLINKFNAQLLLTGTASEKPIVDEIQKLIPEKTFSAAGKTGIKELAALIKRCHLYVCPDSGPMHISAAVKTPVIGIYALKEDFPKRWAPYQCPSRIIRLENIPCPKKCIKGECPYFACYEAVPDSLILEAADKLLKNSWKS